MEELVPMDATQLETLCTQRQWSRARLILEMRAAAQRLRSAKLPEDPSLRRMIREWIRGRRGLSADYAVLFQEIFGVPFATGKPDVIGALDVPGGVTNDDALTDRLGTPALLDAELISLLEAQTQSLRMLDRRLGAARLLAQTQSHTAQMRDMLMYTLPGGQRQALAAATAEAAALAGWQALDLGKPQQSWELHDIAKTAARESEEPAILSHVTAQQAYALLDSDRPADAVTLVQHARESAGSRVPALLRAWLWSAEAEALAAQGEATTAQRALDRAAKLLQPTTLSRDEMPYLALDDVHFARWRGHCLARLGKREAVDELSRAVLRHDPTFKRAEASLHCDLALAYSVRGQHAEARAEARAANELAARTASARQRLRITRLLAASANYEGR